MGQELPAQQHAAALSLPLQQACAFLPFLFFLQQDMSALQQSFMSQQDSAWLEFWAEPRVSAAAEMAMVAPMASVITSA